MKLRDCDLPTLIDRLRDAMERGEIVEIYGTAIGPNGERFEIENWPTLTKDAGWDVALTAALGEGWAGIGSYVSNYDARTHAGPARVVHARRGTESFFSARFPVGASPEAVAEALINTPAGKYPRLRAEAA